MATGYYEMHGHSARSSLSRQSVSQSLMHASSHPNIVQLYGTASSGNVHAAVFHDDLIPFRRFLDLYKDSQFLTVYIHVYIDSELQALARYLKRVSTIDWDLNCAIYIRCSTGRFCADLVPGYIGRFQFDRFDPQQGLRFLAGENSETTVINCLTLDQYHTTCDWEFSATRFMRTSTSATVNLGRVFDCPSQDTFDDMVEIAWLPNPEFIQCGWDINGKLNFGQATADTADRWTRVNSDDATIFSLRFWGWVTEFWLSQANHVFTTLQISSNLHDYVDGEYSEEADDGNETDQSSGDEEFLKDHDEGYSNDTDDTHQYFACEELENVLESRLGPTAAAADQDSEDVPVSNTLEASVDPGELAATFIRRNVPTSSTVEEIIEDSVSPVASHQDIDEMSVSSTFKVVLNVQLFLIFCPVLFWVLFEV
ncbi:hypothetical protein MSAN_00301000 [Mycena sanguinolenta]|uniref:Uncharacterized protein n=1 Tax=Mycena sanguinolenta TaxID=230812 RepID=A0A8H6ZC67_9AGAR|nr:hypothetical protein MSAN_00301000 [Mycena sanguinolenta]